MIRFKHPGSITKGVGKLTPDVWRGIVDAAFWVSKHSTQLESALRTVRAIKQERVHRPWFLAKLTHAKRLTGENNKYLYAWQRVQLGDAVSSAYALSDVSTFDSGESTHNDAYKFGAINLMEASNTSAYTAPGTDVESSVYPSLNFFMNPIGGHATGTGAAAPRQEADVSVALQVNPVVQMWVVRNVTNGGARYFFCASNAHDGDECS